MEIENWELWPLKNLPEFVSDLGSVLKESDD